MLCFRCAASLAASVLKFSQLSCPHQYQVNLGQCCLVMSVPMHVINLQLTISEMLQIQRMWASYQEACDTV